MSKRKPKKTRRDVAEIARENLEKIIGEKLNGEPLDETEDSKKTGRAGGLVGGKARAEKLSSAERRKIAKKAALARWGKGR